MARLRLAQIHHGLTEASCVAQATAALVVIGQLYTVQAARRVTGSRETLIDVPLTVFPSEARGAGAGVAAHPIHTLAPVQTARPPGARLGSTVVHVHLTLNTMCTRRAGAGEAVDEVDAGSSMTTRVRVTLIHVILTVHPLVASLAHTLICALVIHAGGSVAAGVGLALIHSLVTVAACVARLALTLVGITDVHTATHVLTHHLHWDTIPSSIVLTGHVGDVTVQTSPAHRTVT